MSAVPVTQQQKQIRLQKPADWTVWLSLVRMLAQGHKIWDFVNPDHDTKPVEMAEPIEPTIEDSGELDLKKYEIWKAKKDIYKEKMKPFKQRHDAFTELIPKAHPVINFR